ncbi:MAG: di-heme-cytochrome C peroxidase [Isosphaeraceae bacterium]
MKRIPCLGSLFILTLAGVAAAQVGPTRSTDVANQDPLGEPVSEVVYLGQGWTPEQSLDFYFTSQGSQILPYDWFLALEQADSTALFRDSQNMLRFRHLPQRQDRWNPDGLPVGFVAGEGSARRWLGLTCAACHTTEIRYKGVGYRVDGAPTQADVAAMLTSLTYAMQRTFDDPGKFERFAARVQGRGNSQAGRTILRAQLAKEIERREGYNLRNFPGYVPKRTPPAPANYGRLDAVGAIVNEVYFHAVKSPTSPVENTRPANAPVSFPCIWDAPYQGLEQWLGIAKSGGVLDIDSLSRNVGEVIGVFGDLAIPNEPSILGYASSIKMLNLVSLEDSLKTLWSPQWPSAFPAIDQAAAEKGRAIYHRARSCVTCHALIKDRTSPGRVAAASLHAVGTDPLSWANFFGRKGPSGKLQGANVNLIPFTRKIPAIADASTMLTNEVVGAILGSPWPAPPDELSKVSLGLDPSAAATRALAAPQYKARPLNGAWATAPYLHNGSVPNLSELFKPAARRMKSFSIGTLTYDPLNVGFRTDAPGFPKFDTSAPGSSNMGHEGDEYGTNLSDEEKHQLLEYLKTL